MISGRTHGILCNGDIMLNINKSPALSARTPPLNDDDAAARAAELTNEGIEGLIGSVWQSIEQITKAMGEAGWKLEAPVYGASDGATTWIGKAVRRERMFKMVLNSYGLVVEVCNCWMLGEVIELPADPSVKNFWEQ